LMVMKPLAATALLSAVASVCSANTVPINQPNNIIVASAGIATLNAPDSGGNPSGDNGGYSGGFPITRLQDGNIPSSASNDDSTNFIFGPGDPYTAFATLSTAQTLMSIGAYFPDGAATYPNGATGTGPVDGSDRGVGSVTFAYSTNDGGSWTTIATTPTYQISSESSIVSEAYVTGNFAGVDEIEYSFVGNGGNGQPRIDEVFADSVPEPMSVSVLLAAGIGSLSLRRRTTR
jgi:hypothetical protein